MLESGLVAAVSAILSSVKALTLIKGRNPQFDFVFVEPDGTEAAVEVKTKSPDMRRLRELALKLRRTEEPIRHFFLITPDLPTPGELLNFSRTMSIVEDIDSRWLDVTSFAKAIGSPLQTDFKSSTDVSDLLMNQLFEAIKREILLADATGSGERKEQTDQIGASDALEPLPPEYRWMRRQFSDQTIAKMHGRIVGGESLTDILKIGQMVTEITIVMANIKNFSALVKASRPDDVNEIFSKYYRVAKDIVFSHGGTLDKFIGDATVAIFGYPYPDEAATLCAMKAAQEIISAGSGLLADLLDRINEKIETGTRVGIATNDLYPIDIASDGVEVSFVGNAMNLAARLQKESDVDGILLDNRTRNLARRFDPAFVDALNLVERVLPVEAVKGQNHPIRAWQATA